MANITEYGAARKHPCCRIRGGGAIGGVRTAKRGTAARAYRAPGGTATRARAIGGG